MATGDNSLGPLPKSLRILCFGDSLTAGYTMCGFEHHPYADHLRVGLQHMLSISDVEVDVAGLSGDQVQGQYLKRIRAKCAVNKNIPYDWIIIMGGTNDLGWGQNPDAIYEGLKKVWKVALDTGAHVLALNVIECAASSEGMIAKRNSLNAKIKAHQEDRFFTFDLYSAIPYKSLDADAREKLWDDGLHLTAEGYKVMGDVIAARLFEILQSQSRTATRAPGRSFRLQVIPFESSIARRQAISVDSGYLDSTGQIQPDCQEGSVFRIAAGLLFSGSEQISAPTDASFIRFGTSDKVQALDDVFAIAPDESLFWQNGAFSGGTSRFGADSGGILYAILSGPLPGNFTAVALKVLDSDSCPILPTPRASILASSAAFPLVSSLYANSSFSSSESSTAFPVSSTISSVDVASQSTVLPPSSASTSNVVNSSSSTSALSSTALSSSVIESSSTTALSSFSTTSSSIVSSTSVTTTSSGSTSSSSLTTPSSSVISSSSSAVSSSSALGSSNGTTSSSSLSGLSGSTVSSSSSSSSSTSTSTSTSPSSTSTTSASRTSNTLSSSTTFLGVSSSSSTPSLTTSKPTNTNRVAQASEVISREGLTEFCSSLLDYTVSPVTTTVAANASSTISLTTQPTNEIATVLQTYTSYVYVTQAPSEDKPPTILPIAAISAASANGGIPNLVARKVKPHPKIPYVVKRQEPEPVTPTPLQTYDPSDLSSACSANIESATPTTVTITLTSTFLQTIFETEPASTYSSPVLVLLNSTVIANISTTSETAVTVTSNFSTTAAVTNTSIASPTPLLTSETGSSNFSSVNAALNTRIASPVVLSTSGLVVGNLSTMMNASITTPTVLSTPEPTTSDSSILTTASDTSTLDTAVPTTASSTCSPSIILASPTALVGSISGAPHNEDDESYKLTLPFPVQIFDHDSSDVFVSTNGVLSLDKGTNEFSNQCLPSKGPNNAQPAYAVPPYSAFPFWDDTYVYIRQPQGIYYQYGSTPDGTISEVTFEYYLSHWYNNTQYYHYTVFYNSLNPGVFQFKYYQVSDNGFSATVGVQNNNASDFGAGAPVSLQYFCSVCVNPGTPPRPDGKSYRTDVQSQSENCPVGTIVPGLELTVITYPNNTGIINHDTFDNCPPIDNE